MQFSVNHTISEERIKDLIITAFEGGSNYWYQIESDTHGDYLKTLFKKGLEVSNGRMYDSNHPDYVSKFLNKEMILDGLKVMSSKYSRHYLDFTNENEDATTADVFLQCCLFGDILYG